MFQGLFETVVVNADQNPAAMRIIRFSIDLSEGNVSGTAPGTTGFKSHNIATTIDLNKIRRINVAYKSGHRRPRNQQLNSQEVIAHELAHMQMVVEDPSLADIASSDPDSNAFIIDEGRACKLEYQYRKDAGLSPLTWRWDETCNYYIHRLDGL